MKWLPARVRSKREVGRKPPRPLTHTRNLQHAQTGGGLRSPSSLKNEGILIVFHVSARAVCVLPVSLPSIVIRPRPRHPVKVSKSSGGLLLLLRSHGAALSSESATILNSCCCERRRRSAAALCSDSEEMEELQPNSLRLIQLAVLISGGRFLSGEPSACFCTADAAPAVFRSSQ